jgi:hypothetical protein
MCTSVCMYITHVHKPGVNERVLLLADMPSKKRKKREVTARCSASSLTLFLPFSPCFQPWPATVENERVEEQYSRTPERVVEEEAVKSGPHSEKQRVEPLEEPTLPPAFVRKFKDLLYF